MTLRFPNREKANCIKLEIFKLTEKERAPLRATERIAERKNIIVLSDKTDRVS